MNYELLTTFKGTPIEDIIRKLPQIDAEIEAYNIRTFNRFGTYDSDRYRHVCVLCGNTTCIDNSISNQGHKLICVPCVYTFFDGDYAAAASWNRR